MRGMLAIVMVLMVSACEVAVMPRAYYEKLPEKRVATIDDDRVNVAQDGFGAWAAWSSSKAHDRDAQYREQRAIELISTCRIGKIQSKKSDDVTVATVRC